MHPRRHYLGLVSALAVITAGFCAHAQAPLLIYSDSLVNGFQDWGWATRDYSNPAPVHSGAHSIAVTIDSAWAGLQVYHPDFNSTWYRSVSFWINGGARGGQKLRITGFLHVGSTDIAPQTSFSLGTLKTNTWQQFTIPLTALGVAGKSNFTGFVIQDTRGAAQPTFYLDDLQLDAVPAPAVIHLSVNADQPLRAVDARWFGLNTAVWDSHFDTPTTIALLKELGTRVLRFPGGSLSDDYHWASNKTGTNSWQWATSFAKFSRVATNVGAQAIITVNYGSGTAAEAASWVRHANVTNRLGFRYWEVGNECHGTWETDTNANAHDAYTYALRAQDYLRLMRAADPSIKVGLVAVPGEDNSANGYTNHPAVNPRTGRTHYGWTAVLLATLKNLGVTPDFLVHHRYPQWTDKDDPMGSDNDDQLLQGSGVWASDAADLRQQIADYLGPAGTNIELLCTENNSDSGAQGKQSTSLVNALYYADSLGQLAQTEFNAFVWWDLRNGTDTSGCFDATLYGWRAYGDLGLINGLTTRHPAFYAAKLAQSFFQPGDMMLAAASDYPLLTAYAARGASGALSLLVLAKDKTAALTGQIALNGFIPSSAATLRSYGIPQDEAARTNGPAAAQDIAVTNFPSAGTNFTYTFPPLSLTLFTLAPAAPRLSLRSAGASNQILQLDGPPGARYLLQTSTNLTAWTAVATNTLTGPSLAITNPPPRSQKTTFWRARWQP